MNKGDEKGKRQRRLTKMRWNPPVFHISTASNPLLATPNLIFFFFMNVERIV